MKILRNFQFQQEVSFSPFSHSFPASAAKNLSEISSYIPEIIRIYPWVLQEGINHLFCIYLTMKPQGSQVWPLNYHHQPSASLDPFNILILSRLVDTFISRISLSMLLVPKPHNTACVLSWEEVCHWQSNKIYWSQNIRYPLKIYNFDSIRKAALKALLPELHYLLQREFPLFIFNRIKQITFQQPLNLTFHILFIQIPYKHSSSSRSCFGIQEADANYSPVYNKLFH